MLARALKQRLREFKRVEESVYYVFEALRQAIVDVDTRINEIEQELAKQYGPGRLTIKSVRSKSGRRWWYVVYRLRSRPTRDYYVRDKEVMSLLDARRELVRLRAKLYHELLVMRRRYLQGEFMWPLDVKLTLLGIVERHPLYNIIKPYIERLKGTKGRLRLSGRI